jgi:GNAT superfamily N-acetyltransferase
MSTALRPVDEDELVLRSGRHPLVRHLAPHRVPGDTAWSYGAAVALVNGYWDGADEGGDIMVVGPAQDAARLAQALAEEQRRPISLPAAAFELLPDGLLTDPHGWGFRWVDSPVGADPAAAGWLSHADADDEVRRLLDDAFPDASFKPGSPRIRAWAGVRDETGRLIACAADTTETPGVGFVAAITVRPDLRGQGLGRRVTGWTLDRLAEREGLAALWHYGGNRSAARVYDALGMHRLDMVAAKPGAPAAPQVS